MKHNLFICTILFLFSCTSNEDDSGITHENSEMLTPVQSSITFHDNDSIFNQSFKAVSRAKNDSLFWEINFFENNKFKQKITDSTKGLSYLVKAVDINRDSIGELIFVTGYFKKGSDSTEYLKCRIFCYTKKNNLWIGQEAPSPIENPENNNSSEVVEVEKNSIFRKIKNKSGIQKSTFYGLNKNGKLFIK